MGGLGVVFMGTPEFAVPSLTALIAAGHRIVCAYTRAPRPAGRGQRARRSPVHVLAEAHAIPVRCPARLRDAAEVAAFAALAPDVAVVAAYRLILPPGILAAPRLGCLNVHASLLPRWRGAAPIQRAILAGDAETGVTIMKMDEGLDTGPTLARRTVAIGPRANAGTLHDALAEAGAALLVETLAVYAEGRLRPVAQPAEGVSHAPKIERAETRIDWREPAEALDRVVRAFSPAPGAWFLADGARIRVLEAAPVEAPAAPPGTVVGDGPVVACGAGALRLDRLQREGRAAMPAAAFLRGFALPPGSRLDAAADGRP